MSIRKNSVSHVRALTVSAILAASSVVLSLFGFSLPIVPSFLEIDFSDVPALLASFSLGPQYGVLVCLIKNIINFLLTGLSKHAGVGNLSNFILSATFVAVAGVIYLLRKNRKMALLGSFIGAFAMALVCIPSNFFVIYPIYYLIGMPKEAILGLYQAILPSVQGILQGLLIFNAPFTLCKGLLVCGVTFLIYKPLSPLLKGKNQKKYK